MGTFTSLRKAYGALKDSTTVGLAKVNSEFKDLDIAIVKATNHVESPPKERHVRKIFSATSVIQPRADVAYCIHALSKRLSKTRTWVVAMKVLIVIHRTLREGDPTFREELLNYSHRRHILRISNFKDDTSPLAWDCSAWVRTYALFLEERLECYRVLKYDIEAERLPKASGAASKTHRTRMLSGEDLLEQLPALQQLLFRLIGCQPEGAAYSNYLIQYALALVLKESFKIYCAINDGIINLVDMFFEMTRHDAVKALNIYKRAGQQAENLAEFYDYCKGLELARNFQFPTLRQPPPSFLSTMEEYIKEAPQSGSVQKKLEYEEKEEEQEPQEEEQPEEPAEDENQNKNTENDQPLIEEEQEEPQEEKEEEEAKPSPLIDTDDLLGLNEINPQAAEIEEKNALALAIYPPGHENSGPSNSLSLIEAGGSGWELALVTPQNNSDNNNSNPRPTIATKLGGGFDNLLLDSLYEDDTARRQIQLTNAGYGFGATATAGEPASSNPNPFGMQQDPFAMSSNMAPPTNVQMAMQQQQMMMLNNQNPYNNNNYSPYHQHHHFSSNPSSSSSNPFGDAFLALPAPPSSTTQQQHNHHHMLL